MISIARAFGVCLTLAVVALLSAVAGCGKKDDGVTTGQPKKEPEHTHPSKGPHDGVLGETGDEAFHIEFVPNHEKEEARVWILDGDAKNLVPIDAGTELKLTLTNVSPQATILLKAEPEKTDPRGKSSCFVGHHESLAKEMAFKGVVNGKIDGTAYSFRFAEKPREHKRKTK